MLAIRLQRLGKKKKPTYRVIVSENTRDTQAKNTEILGHVNTQTQPSTVVLKKDRIEYWLSVGAQPSATVHNLLVQEGIIKDDKKKSVMISQKRQAKLAEAQKEKAEKEAAAKKAAEEAKAAEAAKAEEPAAEDSKEESKEA